MKPWLVALSVAGLVTACQEPAPAVQQAPTPEPVAPPSDDQRFAAQMSDIGFYVMEAARLAEDRSPSQEVRSLARDLLGEEMAHAAALAAAVAAAGPGAAPTATPPDDKLTLLEGLAALAPEAFDKAYVDQQISAQEESVNSLRLYAATGRTPMLGAYARAALPGAESRLARAREARLELLALQPPPT